MQGFRKVFVVTVLLALTAIFAAPAPQAAKKTSPQVIWDYWYTVSVKSIPAEMYNDKVVLHGDKIQFINDVWKKEEGYINQEQLGAYAMADMALTPLFFNFRSTYRATETVIDGNVHDGKNLVVDVRKAGQSLPSVSHSISQGVFFSSFFPLWIGKELKTLKTGQTVSFSTIFEDDIENGFDTESGTIRLEPSDDIATKLGAKKLVIDIRDEKTYWWVDSRGAALRTVSPTTGAVIERVSQEKAKAFLK